MFWTLIWPSPGWLGVKCQDPDSPKAQWSGYWLARCLFNRMTHEGCGGENSLNKPRTQAAPPRSRQHLYSTFNTVSAGREDKLGFIPAASGGRFIGDRCCDSRPGPLLQVDSRLAAVQNDWYWNPGHSGSYVSRLCGKHAFSFSTQGAQTSLRLT